MRLRIAFIINSIAKGVDFLIEELKDHPLKQSHAIEVCMTAYKGHARELAQEKAGGSELIVAVGGDGTLHEVIDGIMKRELDELNRPGVALIPVGSANDFARMQHISGSLEELEAGISKNAFRKVDVGQIFVKYENRNVFFINVMDSGFGAEVVQRMEEKSIFRKILSSNLRYTLAIIRTFFSYKRKNIEIRIDNDIIISGRILTLIVANSSAFASGLIIAPGAKIDDGRFQIVVGNISLFGYLLNIPRLAKGKRIKTKGVQYFEASVVDIYGAEDLMTEADGELAGKGNVEIKCLPGAIRLLLPNEA